MALLPLGPEAFLARRALAAEAERTLDVQYYVWEDDASGRLLVAGLLEAADRGVHVRMLLDDIHTAGRDPDLVLLDAHPNVEVRLFNPFADRSWRAGDALLEFSRLDHRMHNKAFIADNAAAIVGGRNVGDHYFVADATSNYRDLDLFAAGPVVRELSRSFDGFWNSRWSIPIRSLAGEGRNSPRLGRLAGRIEATAASRQAASFRAALDGTGPAALLADLVRRAAWGEATVVADRPDKPETERPVLIDQLRALVTDSLKGELLIESAYFIPGEAGTQRLCELVGRGVVVRILTNSLASTDVVLAHAGYARYRKPLLACGVELHELRADARFIRRDWRWLPGRSTANLHTKALVIDRHEVAIGSFNLDPRSARLNTELAVVVDSPELAAETAAFIESGMAAENSYRLTLDGHGHLVWTASEGGRPVVFHHEPEAGAWRAFAASLAVLLPLDGQL